MRTLVCGGRFYGDYYWLGTILHLFGPSVVIEGEADGADKMSRRWARDNGVPVEPYPIRRPTENGFDRNARMLADSCPDMVLAFPGQNGTADMIRKARAAGVPTIEVPDK